MVRNIFSSLLLLWSVSYDLLLAAETHYAEKRSWNNQNLFSVPRDLDARIRRLDLSNNVIRELPTLTLPYLERLDLSNNRLDFISEGAFENLVRLEHLNFSRNELNTNLSINSKALQSLSRLKSLDISMNGLTNDAVELYLRKKSSLDQLKMTGNALIKLSRNLFRDSGGLRTIAVDDNMISEIDQGTFEPLSRLETLDLAKNNLAHICDFKLHQLKYLNLSRNSLEFFVTHQDDQLYSLEILDLSFNKLLFFPFVPKMNRLKYLHLQNNMLGTLISEAAMVSQANSLYSEILNENIVRKNNLHANWRLMPLIYIDLSYNHFRFFPLETLSLLPSLETMHFSYNCLQSINWRIRNYNDSGDIRQLFFHSLKHLHLQSNGLARISPLFLKALRQIETLNLQDNAVQPCASADDLRNTYSTSCIAFEHLRTLKHLNLEANDIKMLEPHAFLRTSLVYLNLAKNLHMIMHKGALEGVQTTLQWLIISDMNMSSSRLSLPCMPALIQLNISNNHLTEIPNNLSCSPLREIDIRNNAFITLNQSMIDALSEHLATMFIGGNRFNCCDSRWLTVVNEKKITLADISEAECFAHVTELEMTEYLKSPVSHCLLRNEAHKVHFGQMIIIVLFLTVLVTVLLVFCRRLCSAQKSCMV
ncbi:transforming growth factor beta activator LRRC32-like [Cololabis saira]|uniref:transforming growth factor beta activator LRRC32-like n=1 Tax=Cololabis saira TaxID=129043 RepID=UPI002AD2972B|nr:transforming growth factor beta activator LRRC32-like [Cololabis saira]